MLTITRDTIELPSVSYNLKQEGKLKVGYIKLDEFSSHAAEQMEKAIEDLQTPGSRRFCPGLAGKPRGTCCLLALILLACGWQMATLSKTVDRRGGDRQFSANNTALTNLPLVVLVDRNSASASEILAGAFKDNGRATIVGVNTFGKGTVQAVHSLSDGSGLAVNYFSILSPQRYKY